MKKDIEIPELLAFVSPQGERFTARIINGTKKLLCQDCDKIIVCCGRSIKIVEYWDFYHALADTGHLTRTNNSQFIYEPMDDDGWQNLFGEFPVPAMT